MSVNGSLCLSTVELAHDDVGSGEPLVLLHGHPFDRTMWRRQVRHFAAAGRRVIAPDLRGYGESPVVPGATPVEAFARDVAALLDRLGLEEVVLGGLAMGGQVAMEFHRLFPERLTGLILADTTPRADSEPCRRQRRDAADRVLREGMVPVAGELLPKMLASETIVSGPAVAENVLLMMWGVSPDGAAAGLRGRADRLDYVDMLADVTVPVLVVVGRHDELMPVAEAELMHERLPHSELVVIDGAGHLPNLERPAAFNRALERFLASLEPAAAYS
ncbi:MAG TPA: alpha/beta hydrolase [Solirubrobacteraceae bacterium]|jgi:pimeloyl-ACP methyl ester carboxylesterase|nr:alpha/beta hydrolase [Solirubrobacteraceae bacterium]